MPKINLDLTVPLSTCPAKKGVGAFTMAGYVNKHFSDTASQTITIKLDDGSSMQFLSHTENNKTVLSSMNSLASSCPDGVPVDKLPEILAKLAEQKVQFTALQFPHAFMIKGWLSGIAYRAHFNHIVIYKDSSDKLNAGVIDSSLNPFGIYNPVLGGWVSTSILSGEELLQAKLTRLLGQPDARNALQDLCGIAGDKVMVNMISPIFTWKQPSTVDKRCSVYTLSSMAQLVNHILEDDKVTTESVTKTVTEAHQALNELQMMEISYPVEKGAEVKQVV